MFNLKSTLVALSIVLTLSQCNSQTITIDPTDTSIHQIVVDVRTVEEWNQDGHNDCSVNYPLDQFESQIAELKKYDKIILVCRSGNRAGKAKQLLLNAGYNKPIENLGAWQNVSCKTK